MQTVEVGRRGPTGPELEVPPVPKKNESLQRIQSAAERSGISEVPENEQIPIQVPRPIKSLESEGGLDVARAVSDVEQKENQRIGSPQLHPEEAREDLELMAKMYPDIQLLPREGMPVSAGERRYWIQFVSSEAKKETFRLYSLQGGSWQEIDRIIIDPRKEGFSCISQEGGTRFSPAVRECLTACSQKLQTMSVMYLELTNNNVEDTTARKIIMPWANQWRGCFVEPSDPSVTVLQQYRGPDRIKGLKVGGAAGQRYADYALGELQSGSSRKVKKVLHIFPDGSIKPIVRFTKKNEALREVFLKDVQKELDVRQALIEEGEKNPGLEEEMRNKHIDEYIFFLKKFHSHIGKDGQVKVRFLGKIASGDLHDVMDTQDPPPLPHVIYACLNVLKGLRFMHLRWYVHSDVKIENMLLFDKWKGKLADHGLAGRVGEERTSGSFDYIAPEVIEGEKRLFPSRDMFSFGVSLLKTIAFKGLDLDGMSSVRIWDWLSETNSCRIYRNISQEDHRTVIERVQSLLREARENPKYHPLYLLVADLMSYNPSERPDAAEAERRLKEVIAQLR